jgi:hypothetical protein
MTEPPAYVRRDDFPCVLENRQFISFFPVRRSRHSQRCFFLSCAVIREYWRYEKNYVRALECRLDDPKIDFVLFRPPADASRRAPSLAGTAARPRDRPRSRNERSRRPVGRNGPRLVDVGAFRLWGARNVPWGDSLSTTCREGRWGEGIRRRAASDRVLEPSYAPIEAETVLKAAAVEPIGRHW